jgi:hypothetical protein
MTHERAANAEADGGPEADASLPDATSIPVADTPDALPPVSWPDEWDDQ